MSHSLDKGQVIKEAVITGTGAFAVERGLEFLANKGAMKAAAIGIRGAAGGVLRGILAIVSKIHPAVAIGATLLIAHEMGRKERRMAQ